jgi:hypothetical protein
MMSNISPTLTATQRKGILDQVLFLHDLLVKPGGVHTDENTA